VNFECIHTAGQMLSCPLLIAPMAMQRLAHEDGELAVARAAASEGVSMASDFLLSFFMAVQLAEKFQQIAVVS